MDQRVEQLEQTVQSLSGGQEGIAKRLEELFSQLNVRMDRLTSQSSQGKGIDSDTATPESRIRPNSSGATSSYTPKMVKLDFPRFDEKEDATSWVCRAEQFFQFHRTPDEDRVEIASFHMIGDAQLWYQVLRRENPSITWDEFKEGFYSRYGANQLTDFFGELAKLQQQGTVQSYQVQFEKLLAKVGDLSQARQKPLRLLGCLKQEIQLQGRDSPPLAQRISTRTHSQSPTNSPQPATGNIKRLTWDELNERKRLGLCFKCNEKFGPGHRCKKLFSIQAVLEDSDDDADMEIEEHDPTEEIPAISLHAIAGFEGPETMRLTGTVEKLKGIILVDSGSTHNFVSESFAKRAGIEPTNAKKLKVQVASGEELISPGTQWLRTLGPIIWDFSKLLMAFFQNGKHVIFQGSQIPENQIVSAEHMEQLVKLLKRGFLLQITGSTQSCSQVPELHPEIQGLLEEFRGVLAKPKGLPPQRCHDHKIPLKTPEPISVQEVKNSLYHTRKSFLGNSSIKVTNISIDGELQIRSEISRRCYDKLSGNVYWETNWLRLSKFRISKLKNKFTVVGCDSYACLRGFREGKAYRAGCMSTCDSFDSVYNKSCAGSGCCQMEIPDGLYYTNVTAYSFDSHKKVQEFNPCTYAFVVEDDKFDFSSEYLKNIPEDTEFTMVLEWSIDNNTLSTLCKDNAESYQPDNVSGYRCRCKKGYEGNPYLGCRDTNECNHANNCSHICIDLEGSYRCDCPRDTMGMFESF
ncbi:hypothetical protein GH714_022289 [Hevea brasiliensis]|uniref:EGF-like domain-containing protein n=1 Tax=Hevea brasiliensis TaxID=3981 RepID=A0A6A6KRZ1_HEVBR|nr:hypothetical protein GH714_022289 [Hevea brasiliensis]